MDKMNVIPLNEVAGIKFGMKRADVRKIFGKATEFKKSKFSKITTDDFGFCHVFYDKNNQCEAVEIFSEAEVYVDGKKVFPITLDEYSKNIGNLQKDDDSYIDVKQSIGIYAPSGNMESILFGNVGYYDEI
jgi:hypothetical protein